ncbi:hypothetical protein CgunFtcFv8_012049 [Champsocephalus gunnari]|uniref:Rab11 family-interacting protein 5 n=1 Tax=Champsocephalus gunnari TaxID=52237 RepID=A0AAN8DAE9_CHAGU|nr:hypothetical protein CgunFtcFv8_012049 [Champsocephalus gunnari]
MSSLTVEEDQKWLPTQVQVTVLRSRGLRGKGKHGTSDVYTIIQLGKEKYSTGVVEKTTEPEWREECSFELQPGVLQGGGRNGGCPAGATELVLIVMHRAHMGMDVFLGQVVIQLDKVFHESRCVKNEWYKLNSKSGKKEKERGEIQATVQFTRNNLTASMYDLVMTDKSASTFGKLKERIKGKRRSSEEDSSSAVLPSGYGSLHRMRQRLPSDGGGEEDYEDDEGGEARRSKMRTFFLRGKLRKSSDTRSSTSLGSESSESSRGGSLSPTAGISMVVSDLSNSPSNSSNLSPDNSPEHTANSLQCEYGDDAGEISIIVPPLPTAWVNGGDAYSDLPLDKGSVNPVDSLGLPPLQKSLPLSVSLQNLRPASAAPKSPMGDGRRWSFDKPDEEEKAAIAAALEKSGPMLGDEEEEEEEEGLGYAAQIKSSSSTVESGKKQRRNFFSHGRGESAGKGQSRGKDESEQAPAAEEKHKGWFGSKDSNSKPSLVVSPKLEPSTDPHPPPLPPSHPPGPPVDPLVSLHHTNPFSQSTSPPMSPCNPFLSFIQQNLFYDTMLNAEPLKPSLPTLPYLSSARPPIAQLFPQASNPYPTLNDENPTAEDSGIRTKSDAKKRPLPPPPTYEDKPLNVKSSGHFMSAGALEPEWDESFEAFAAGRLQSPEDMTADCKTQQNTPNKLAETQNFESSILGFEKSSDSSVVRKPSESKDDVTDRSIDLDLEDEAQHNVIQHSDGGENADLDGSLVPTSLKVTHQQPVGETGSKGADTQSPNLSYFSPELQPLSKIYLQPDNENGKEGIDKKEEAEKLNFERSIVGFCEEEESVEGKPSESEVHITNGSNDQSLAQHHVTQHRDGGEKADVHGIQGSLGPMSPVLTHRQPAGEAGSEDAADLLPELHTKPNIFVQSVKENGKKGNSSAKDFVSGVSPFSGKFPAFSLEEAEEQNFESSVLRFSKEESVVKKPPKSEEDTTDRSNDPSLVDLAKHDVIQHGETDEKADLDGIEGSLAPMSPVISHQQPAGDTGSEDASSFSNLLTELHTKSDISLQPDNEKGKDIGEMNTSVEDFSKLLNDSSISEINTTDVTTPDDKLYSTQQSLRIITSSPNVRHGSSDSPIESTGLGGQDASQRSGVPFGLFDDFLNTSPSQDFDDTIGSEKNETLHSANSTLCGDLIEIQTTPEAALDQKDSRSHPFHEEFDNIGGSFFGAKDTTPTLKPSFTIEDNFGLLSEASTDLYKSYNPWNLDDEAVQYQHVVLGDMFSKSPQAQSTTLPRSHSEGTLTPAFEDLLQPFYGSDPGAIQASSSAPPLSPDLPSLTSFAPSLTPSSSSSFSLPFLYNATARSPPSTAMLEEMHRQQQAANQQNSPHPVKPLTTTTSAEEKRTEGRSVLATGLEKLKSSISPGRSSQLSEQETSKKKPVSEGAGSYFHLNHSELVALLVQREAELERQEDEFKRQKRLLAKREVELKKLKPQVKDLEDYIDTLLVRIMEQKPTLLQVRSKLK